MMQELLIEMHRAAMNEYKRASEAKGKAFVDGHHAFAVVLEEVGEAMEDMNVMTDWLHRIWACTKHDHNPAPAYKSMRDTALEAAAECIQVAAMCDKALRSEGVVKE